MAEDSVAMEAYLAHLRLRTAPALVHASRPDAPSPAPVRPRDDKSPGGGSSGDASPEVIAGSGIKASGRQHAVHVHTSAVRAAGPTGDPFMANSKADGNDELHQQQGFWKALMEADPVIQVGPLAARGWAR